jgi:hypothetical protein
MTVDVQEVAKTIVYVCSMLNGFFFAAAWSDLRLRVERAASRYGGWLPLY